MIKEEKMKFTPSENLVELVEKHMISPDEEEVIELLEEIQKEKEITTADIKHNIAVIITEQVEGLIVSLAKNIYMTKEPIKISEDNRFTSEICKELINRLGLDPYNPRLVLDELYCELLNFISLIPRERVWGKIIVEDSKLKLKINDSVKEWEKIKKLYEYSILFEANIVIAAENEKMAEAKAATLSLDEVSNLLEQDMGEFHQYGVPDLYNEREAPVDQNDLEIEAHIVL